jgi:hypothetical protein
LKGFKAVAPDKDGRGKQHGQDKPADAPGDGFAELDLAGAPVKRAEVNRQEKQNAKDETQPMPGRDFGHL